MEDVLEAGMFLTCHPYKYDQTHIKYTKYVYITVAASNKHTCYTYEQNMSLYIPATGIYCFQSIQKVANRTNVTFHNFIHKYTKEMN